MKTINKLFLLFFVFATVGCNDGFLDTDDLNNPSADVFWTSQENAERWINTSYRGLPGVDDLYFDGMSDDCYSDNNDARIIGNGTHEPTSTRIRTLRWSTAWSYIKHNLELIEKIDVIEKIDATAKKRLLGQARFFLAKLYFDLSALHRDVPLLKKVPQTIPESDVAVSTREEIYKYCLEQLDEILKNDELPDRWPTADRGRITKGAALTLKAQIKLFQKDWPGAAEAAKAVIDLNVYSLANNYPELFLTSKKNSADRLKEVILEQQYQPNVFTHTQQFLAYPLTGGTAYIAPIEDLLNAYEDINGLPITEPGALYDPANPFDNRDPRLYHTILLPVAGPNPDKPWNVLAGIPKKIFVPYVDPGNRDRTGMTMRKYVDDIADQQRTSDNNWIIYRYADVLLMYAEAKNEASGPDASIYDVLDLIRQRVGMPKVDRAKYGSKDALREKIRHERRIELAVEGKRYFDIIRWGIAEKVLNKTVTNIPPVPGTNMLPVATIEKRVFDAKRHYVWPIPSSAIDNAKNLVQHPEWK